MCGRFTLTSNKETIKKRFDIVNEFEMLKPQYNIAPTESVLAVIYNGPLMDRKRCLIIADSFYEWRKNSQDKQPERIQVKNRHLFAFAGLFDTWRQGDEVIHSCTLLTKESDTFMEQIHPRMPIILPPDYEDDWINSSLRNKNEAAKFLHNIPSENLTSYTVSNYVNNVNNKDYKCIEAVDK